jgi:hypothetical protein
VRHATQTPLRVVIPYATAMSLPSVFTQPTPTLIVATKLGYTSAVTAALAARLYPREPHASNFLRVYHNLAIGTIGGILRVSVRRDHR